MDDPTAPDAADPLDTVRERPGGRSARIRADVLDAARAELLAGGYTALSHRAVARRAGVDPATVYRRWPTRSRLATDALLAVASRTVPAPDTGGLEGDLQGLLDGIVAALRDPVMLRLFHALSAAGAEADGDLSVTLRDFWQARFGPAEAIIGRAVGRGELAAGVDAHAVVETLVAPAYFRALVTGEAMDAAFARRCVEHAVRSAGTVT